MHPQSVPGKHLILGEVFQIECADIVAKRKIPSERQGRHQPAPAGPVRMPQNLPLDRSGLVVKIQHS